LWTKTYHHLKHPAVNLHQPQPKTNSFTTPLPHHHQHHTLQPLSNFQNNHNQVPSVSLHCTPIHATNKSPSPPHCNSKTFFFNQTFLHTLHTVYHCQTLYHSTTDHSAFQQPQMLFNCSHICINTATAHKLREILIF